MKKNLLAITGVFFPHNETVTQISYKHLCNLDYNIDVATFKFTEDNSIKSIIKEDEKFKKFSFYYVDKDWKKTYVSKNNLNVFNIKRYIKLYYKLCLKMISKKKYDILYSNSVPNYTHYAAYLIKKKLGSKIKWYASFSDPIINNPYVSAMKRKNIFTKDMVAYFLQKPIHYKSKYQKLAFKYADRLIFVSEELRDFMIKDDKELLKKSIIVPITYVDDWPYTQKLININTKNLVKHNKIKFMHFGNIYGLRKINVFLSAIFELKTYYPEIYEKFEIHQYGYIEPNQYKLIDIYNLSDIFKVHNRVEYEKCLDIMINEADVLLIFDTILEKSKLQPFLPSKIIDYLLTQKPIFSLTMKKSPLYKMIGCEHICVENNISDIKQGIMRQIKLLNDVKYDYSNFENKKVIKNTLGKELKCIDI